MDALRPFDSSTGRFRGIPVAVRVGREPVVEVQYSFTSFLRSPYPGETNHFASLGGDDEVADSIIAPVALPLTNQLHRLRARAHHQVWTVLVSPWVRMDLEDRIHIRILRHSQP